MPRASWGPQHQWFSRASFYRVCYCESTFRSSHWHMTNPVTPLSVLWSFLSVLHQGPSLLRIPSWKSGWSSCEPSPSGPLRIDSGDATWVLPIPLASSLHLPQPGTTPSTELRFLFLVFGWPLFSGVIVSSVLLHGGSLISFCPSIKDFRGNAYSYKHWAVTL